MNPDEHHPDSRHLPARDHGSHRPQYLRRLTSQANHVTLRVQRTPTRYGWGFFFCPTAPSKPTNGAAGSCQAAAHPPQHPNPQPNGSLRDTGGTPQQGSQPDAFHPRRTSGGGGTRAGRRERRSPTVPGMSRRHDGVQYGGTVQRCTWSVSQARQFRFDHRDDSCPASTVHDIGHPRLVNVALMGEQFLGGYRDRSRRDQ